ncbi:hypothetical protein J7T55_000556 [Diaporthe amygdali]|uniref:uncharacterized protein n=1 Tax=Phomopsis amygdali TaxID=1214568 RepID=UPI0022FE56B4|nr:uncharacterized protein J7T55_000556 [Diaporthe amygdali]KAJ0110124.1 hypothetical protein J7T55_000556 [Diaporthe amygdali]
MDAIQHRGRLRAFLKHATIRISSHKDHGFSNDSASAHSIDDDGRSQRSSKSAKKDSKLRRIGRGIRQWREKRRRSHGDTRPETSHTFGGKSFSSSEASLVEEKFGVEAVPNEDASIDRPKNDPLEVSKGVNLEGASKEALPRENMHEKVALHQDASEDTNLGDIQGSTPSGKEVIIPQATIPIPPPPVYSSLVWSDLAPPAKTLKPPSGVVFRRDRKNASEFARNTLSSEPALWTDASYRVEAPEGCNSEHYGGIAVAQKFDQRWTVHSAHTRGVTDTNHLESLAILMALQMAVQEKKAGILGEGTVYICSDSDTALRWLEKVFTLATAIRRAAWEARALEADVDDLKCLIRLSNELSRWEPFRFSEYKCPEKSLMASIGRRILEQYYELRGLGAWVEFHWVPGHSGLPGNMIADRIAALSCCWVMKWAPPSAHDAGLVIPLKVLAFDEPWKKFFPQQEQRQYNKVEALQLLEDTKDLQVVLSTKALESPSCDRSAAPIAEGVGTDVVALQPASRGTTWSLGLPPSVHTSPESGEVTIIPSDPYVKAKAPPKHGIPYVSHNEVVSIPPAPYPIPLPVPQPQSKTRKQRRGKTRSKTSGNFSCAHCGQVGHLIKYCFDKFPEHKIANPKGYARYGGRMRLEKRTPGAFQSLARLHPQMMAQPIHGQDSRYMLGRVGITPHLTPKQCAVWAVQYQASEPGQSAVADSVQDHRRRLREKYRWDEAQGAQPD